MLIDNWTTARRTGKVALTAGKYDIKMEFYDSGYDAIAELRWESPSIPRQFIPAAKLLAG